MKKSDLQAQNDCQPIYALYLNEKWFLQRKSDIIIFQQILVSSWWEEREPENHLVFTRYLTDEVAWRPLAEIIVWVKPIAEVGTAIDRFKFINIFDTVGVSEADGFYQFNKF